MIETATAIKRFVKHAFQFVNIHNPNSHSNLKKTSVLNKFSGFFFLASSTMPLLYGLKELLSSLLKSKEQRKLLGQHVFHDISQLLIKFL